MAQTAASVDAMSAADAFSEQERYILRYLGTNTEPGQWEQVAEFAQVVKQREVEGKVRDYTRRFRIKGRKPALQRLMNLGLVHVRTATYSPWGAARKADPHPAYDRVQWQAVLTPQGRDVASLL